MIFAVIPAAGKSQRMGRPKLSLPLGTSTVIEHVVTALKRGGIEQILIVTGPNAAELEELARRAGAAVLRLAQETPDMRTTVEMGLHHLQDMHSPNENDNWLLVPADHPALNADLIRTVCEAHQEGLSILIPTYQGKRGHPTLIGWKHVEGLLSYPRPSGINRYLREFPHETREIEVDSADVLVDLDTPDDYARLIARFPSC